MLVALVSTRALQNPHHPLKLRYPRWVLTSNNKLRRDVNWLHPELLQLELEVNDVARFTQCLTLGLDLEVQRLATLISDDTPHKIGTDYHVFAALCNNDMVILKLILALAEVASEYKQHKRYGIYVNAVLGLNWYNVSRMQGTHVVWWNTVTANYFQQYLSTGNISMNMPVDLIRRLHVVAAVTDNNVLALQQLIPPTLFTDVDEADLNLRSLLQDITVSGALYINDKVEMLQFLLPQLDVTVVEGFKAVLQVAHQCLRVLNNRYHRPSTMEGLEYLQRVVPSALPANLTSTDDLWFLVRPLINLNQIGLVLTAANARTYPEELRALYRTIGTRLSMDEVVQLLREAPDPVLRDIILQPDTVDTTGARARLVSRIRV